MSLINTKLEAEFNLAHVTANSAKELNVIEKKDNKSENLALTAVQYDELDKIEKALPQVNGLNSSDEELDELAEYAVAGYKDLLELSKNVEERFCGEVAGAAANMLGHAITAKTNKIKKKLDMISLQIKKQIADSKVKNENENESLDGQSKLLDRNELLKLLNSPK
jgi:hypothetical protein